jgi:FHA domain
MPQLQVIAGPLAGTTFAVPVGFSTIGREVDADVHLAEVEISRRHATLQRDGGRVILTDLGSTNGTSVNGRRLHGSLELRIGDVIQIGPIELVYRVDERAGSLPGPHPGPPPGTQPGPPSGRVRGQVSLIRPILIAAAVSLLGWLINAASTYFAGRALSGIAWLLSPAAAVLAGIASTVIEAATGPAAPKAGETRQPPARGRGVPAAVAALAVLLVIGVGGYGATVGIRYAVGWVTGNEQQVGRERLAAPAPSASSGRVSATVTSVVDTAHYTRVRLTVTNGERQPATLTLFHNCVLTGGGVTLQADDFKSDWTSEVPPDSTQQGTVTFSGHLPDGAVTAQLSFLNVFVFGRFGVDDTLVIKPIPLRGS